MCLLYPWVPLVTHVLFLSQLYRPHQLYLLPSASGPLSALALFGRATTVIVLVIATL